jgi:hypothetical protein
MMMTASRGSDAERRLRSSRSGTPLASSVIASTGTADARDSVRLIFRNVILQQRAQQRE